MDETRIRELDKSNMLQMLRAFPQQFTKALEWFPKDMNLPKASGAILCGMGGSSLPGDIVNALWIDQVRLEISREYDLPVWIKDDTLVFLCSFSGNTEETIAAYGKARERGLPVCVITKGGKLATMAKDAGDPLLIIDEQMPGFQPRFGSGYFYAYILLAMQKAGLIDADVEAHLKELSRILGDVNPEEEARELAGRLEGRVPMVYASGAYTDSVGRIWKIKFNENTKIPAFYNSVPELNHNEMVGFTNLLEAPLLVLMLRDSDEHPRVARRFEAMKGVFNEYKVQWLETWFAGDSMAEKLFRMLYLGDFTTYFLALKYGYDPAPVVIVESFKAAITD